MSVIQNGKPKALTLAGNVNRAILRTDDYYVNEGELGEAPFGFTNSVTVGNWMELEWAARPDLVIRFDVVASPTGLYEVLPQSSVGGGTDVEYAEYLVGKFKAVPQLIEDFKIYQKDAPDNDYVTFTARQKGADYNISFNVDDETQWDGLPVTLGVDVETYENHTLDVQVWVSDQHYDTTDEYHDNGVAMPLLRVHPDKEDNVPVDLNEALMHVEWKHCPPRVPFKPYGVVNGVKVENDLRILFAARAYERRGPVPEVVDYTNLEIDGFTLSEPNLNGYSGIALNGALPRVIWEENHMLEYFEKPTAGTGNLTGFLIDHYKSTDGSIKYMRVTPDTPLLLYFLWFNSTGIVNPITVSSDRLLQNGSVISDSVIGYTPSLDEAGQLFVADICSHGAHNWGFAPMEKLEVYLKYMNEEVERIGFIYDLRDKYEENYIAYRNSYGVWQVMPFLGKTTIEAEVQKESARRLQYPNYDRLTPDLVNINAYWRDQRTIYTDFLNKEEKKNFLSVVASRETYLYFGSTKVPSGALPKGGIGQWVPCYIDTNEVYLYGTDDDTTGGSIVVYIGDKQKGAYEEFSGHIQQ